MIESTFANFMTGLVTIAIPLMALAGFLLVMRFLRAVLFDFKSTGKWIAKEMMGMVLFVAAIMFIGWLMCKTGMMCIGLEPPK